MGGGTLHPLPPLGVISDTNQSGLILILTGLSLSFVLVSFAIRVYIRHPKGLWKLDDNFLTAATVLACTQSSIIVRATNAGLGNKQRDGSEAVEKLYFASHYLYIIELLLSKLSIAALYLRLTRARHHRYAIWSIVGVCLVWLILSILLLSIGYSWPSAFTIPFSRWLTIGVVDCVTDASLALMSVYLVKDLQLSLERKAIVIVAFGVRIFTIFPCALRLYYLQPHSISHNRTLATSLAVVCTQLQLGYALMAASVAVLKPFIVVYDKPESDSYLSGSQPLSNPSRSYYKRASRSKTESFKMQSLRSTHSVKSTRSQKSTTLTTGVDGGMLVGSNEAQIGPVSGRSTRVITTGPFVPERNNSSGGSHDSQRKMIIERRDEWSIRYYEEDEAAAAAAAAAEEGDFPDGGVGDENATNNPFVPDAVASSSRSGSGSGSGSGRKANSSASTCEQGEAAVKAWAPDAIGLAK